MTYTLRTWPDPVLNKRCSDINPLHPELLAEVIPAMLEVVRNPAAPGLGLAANQVGYMGRVIVVKLSQEGDFVPMINPVIKDKFGGLRGPEACLSLPGVRIPNVFRFAEIEVAYTTPEGKDMYRTLRDADAVVVQHEIDHLNGKTLADHPGVRKWTSATTSNAAILDNLKQAWKAKQETKT